MAWDAAEKLQEECDDAGIVVLGGRVPLPSALREIPNPPLLLYLQGNPEILDLKGIAVIGTREPTSFGRKSARRMAHVLAERGWCVVSGLAEGCDTEGHEGCLAAGGKTIAVLAHGFGRIYPAKNKQLADRILESGGALITEYAPGTPPTRSSFIERDRLQSGLSLGIIVVETDIKGGTMHTVGHAQAQGRGIGAISHPPELSDVSKSQGNQKLIREEIATPLRDRDDLIRFAESLVDHDLPNQPPMNIQATLDLYP